MRDGTREFERSSVEIFFEEALLFFKEDDLLEKNERLDLQDEFNISGLLKLTSSSLGDLSIGVLSFDLDS